MKSELDPRIVEFKKDRDEALLSFDDQKVRDFALKYKTSLARAGTESPRDRIVFWGAVHKAISALESFKEEDRFKSIFWLRTRGMDTFPGLPREFLLRYQSWVTDILTSKMSSILSSEDWRDAWKEESGK